MDPQAPHGSFPARPKIVFMGTPQFAVPTLQVLISEGYEVASVITQPDRPRGRGQKVIPSPVKMLAVENHLTILQPEKLDESFLEILLAVKPELLVVVAFGQIIPGKVLGSAPWGGINVHASLLPKYRGSAPIQWAIINNEQETGLTTMFMDEGMDTGPILLQQKVPIRAGETAGELHDRLSGLAPALLLKTLKGLAEGGIEPIEQNESAATYTSKLTKEDGQLDWSWPAERLCGLIRGLDPWPGAFTVHKGKMLKLYRCSLAETRAGGLVPGRIRGLTEKGLEIDTGKGAIRVREIQAPGKKRMTVQEFMRGSPMAPGSIIGEKR